MWHQCINRNFTNLRKYFFHAKKTKITFYLTILLPELRLPSFRRVPKNVIAVISIVYALGKACVCVAILSKMEGGGNCWINSLFLFSLHTKCIRLASQNLNWANDVIRMSLLRFWTWEHNSCVAVYKRDRALRFHQKYLNVCSEGEQRSYRFGTTWGWE